MRLEALESIGALPLLWVTLSLLAYALSRRLYLRLRVAALHPVILASAALIAVLRLTDTTYETYMQGGRLIEFFLGPSVVALAVPLYLNLQEMKSSAPSLLVVTAFGSAVGVVSAVVPALLMGAPEPVVLGLAPKSVTTPIAISVAEGIGGEPALTASFVVLTGVLGAIIGPLLLRLVGVRHPVAFGLAMGSAAHGIGTARALENGRLEGAAGGLGICLCGVMTALIAPLLTGLLL